VPATALIGYGQALIVNSFYRIGMRDISASDAGAGSAILSTLQQATLGLGPAILGSLFLTLAPRRRQLSAGADRFPGGGGGNDAALGAIALWLRHHLNIRPVATAS
jgi:hypothetical protein